MAKRPKRKPAPEPPVIVAIDHAVIDTARAMHPIAHDWTDSQLVAACLALSCKPRLPYPRIGLVHSD